MHGASLNADGAHPGLHLKPLYAAIGQVPAPHCPGGRHGRQFVENTQNTNKKQFVSSNYGTTQSLVVYENFIPPKEPFTRLIDATSWVRM
jgi:hypothetical protein